MSWHDNILVLANRTAATDDLVDDLRGRAQRRPSHFTLVVPAERGHAQDAERTLAGALGRLREAGLEASGHVGDPDPFYAATETFDPREFDGIVVSTLPTGVSRWLKADLPQRIERATGAPVAHVVARPPAHRPPPKPSPPRESRGVLDPLTVLTWGHPRD